MMTRTSQNRTRTAKAAFSARHFSNDASMNTTHGSVIMDTVNAVSVFVLSVLGLVSIILRAILSIRIMNVILAILVVITKNNQTNGNLNALA